MSLRRRLADDPPEINLIPMLDMVSLLIQLLLVNAQFGVFAEVAAAVGAPSANPLPGTQLRVDVGETGFAVSWNEPSGMETRQLPCASNSCAAPEAYDTAGLAELARNIKGLHPEETQVQLIVGPDVPFEVMAGAMDAMRGPRGAPALFDDVVLGG